MVLLLPSLTWMMGGRGVIGPHESYVCVCVPCVCVGLSVVCGLWFVPRSASRPISDYLEERQSHRNEFLPMDVAWTWRTKQVASTILT